MSLVLAIAALRLRLALRRLRGGARVVNLVALILLAVLGAAFAGGAAVGAAVMIHVLAESGSVDKLRVGYQFVFYLCFFLGLVLPVLRGALEQGFDASPFLLFPIGRGRLYAILLGATAIGTDHLLYYPALLATAATGPLQHGAKPLFGLALVALFAVFLVTWSNVFTLLLGTVMRARRVREVVAIAGLALLIVVSLVPAIFDKDVGGRELRLSELRSAFGRAAVVTRLLPPSIVADALVALEEAEGGGTGRALGAGLGLLAWDLLGLGLGYVVFVRRHLGERTIAVGSTASRRGARAARGWSFDAAPFSALPSAVRAVAAKDLRYLLRSVAGRFVLFVGPLFVLFVVVMVGRGLDEPVLGLAPQRVLLFGMTLYTTLFSNNFVNNSFAWEGDGVKSYYLAPVSPRAVLVGKNLALWLFNGLLFGLTLVTWSVVRELPDPVALASVILFYGASLLSFTSCGNVLSVLFPVARDMSSPKTQPAHLAILISIGVLLATTLVLGSLLTLPAVFGWPALAPLLLAAALAVLLGVYVVALGLAARLFEERKERVIEALRSAR